MGDTNSDDWEEQMLKEMAEMFSKMGMPIDISMLKNMMSQVREQFEKMGIDPEMSNKDMKIDINGDPDEFRRTMESMLNGPDGISELFRNMGVNVQVNNPTPVVDAELETEDDIDEKLLVAEIHIHEDRMYATVDLSRELDIVESELELNLIDGGNTLQLMRKTQLRPFKKFDLPESAGGVVEWSLNNGILDVIFDIRNNN